MVRDPAPLPMVEGSIAQRVVLQMAQIDEEDLGSYLDGQLAKVTSENPTLGAVLMNCKTVLEERYDEETSQDAFCIALIVYQLLKQQTKLNYRKLFLRIKQRARSEEKSRTQP